MLGTNSQLCGICRNGWSCAWKYSAVTWREEPMSLSLQRERACGSLCAPSMAADLCRSFVAPRSFSPAGVLSQLDFSGYSRMTNSSHNPFKHKHGRILLVTLCHKKVWICVCMNFCTICSLSYSTEWDFCLPCSVPNRYVWYWWLLRHSTDCTDFFH